MSMNEIFTGGHIADLILGIMILEGIVLIVLRRRTGVRVLDIVLTLLPGILLALALRAALTDASWIWIGLPLALAFPVHIADLRRRWR